MIRRVIPLVAFALVAFAAACGGGGSDIPDDPRVRVIGATAEKATYAWARDGAPALYEFLAPEVTQRCSREQLQQTLAGQQAPTGFRGLKKVDLKADEARVTVILIMRDHDENVEWIFVPGPQDSWRLSDLPGLKECGS